ncbi:hypothetical protein OG778_06940 [Streptomyces sp. NBC_00184]|uniref:hypothetical protein n=1 Tax=unclassified Streptomyces TaxID=2593676 RepID=UPI002E2AC358|nr:MULTISPECIES: hypothetical protein [unclassified Streptomyces]
MTKRNGTRRAARHAWCAAAVVGPVLLAGCGSGGGDGNDIPPTATGTLEELAAQARCEPKLQTDAQELRQANCVTDDGRYVLATFATDRGQREWINEANDYGGSYLVGRRWVAVSDAAVIAALRGRLGGTVETASPHHPGSGGDGGNEAGHSGHPGS